MVSLADCGLYHTMSAMATETVTVKHDKCTLVGSGSGGDTENDAGEERAGAGIIGQPGAPIASGSNVEWHMQNADALSERCGTYLPQEGVYQGSRAFAAGTAESGMVHMFRTEVQAKAAGTCAVTAISGAAQRLHGKTAAEGDAIASAVMEEVVGQGNAGGGLTQPSGADATWEVVTAAVARLFPDEVMSGEMAVVTWQAMADEKGRVAKEVVARLAQRKGVVALVVWAPLTAAPSTSAVPENIDSTGPRQRIKAGHWELWIIQFGPVVTGAATTEDAIVTVTESWGMTNTGKRAKPYDAWRMGRQGHMWAGVVKLKPNGALRISR